jgi:hypothetical protein
MEHTPTPYKAAGSLIYDEDRRIVAECCGSPFTKKQREANAAFFAKACNEHYEILLDVTVLRNVFGAIRLRSVHDPNDSAEALRDWLKEVVALSDEGIRAADYRLAKGLDGQGDHDDEGEDGQA